MWKVRGSPDPLKDIHKKKRMDWAKNNMKVHFQSVLFTDKCRATLDGPDGWRRGWYCKEGPRPDLNESDVSKVGAV